MTRLPQPGGDKGSWGDVLNDFLSQSHNIDGTLKPVAQSNVTGLVTALAAKADISALASKANTADLATVATSGSYADLANKPAIPTQASDIGAVAATVNGTNVGSLTITDATASDVPFTPTGSLSATNVQAAITALLARIVSLESGAPATNDLLTEDGQLLTTEAADLLVFA